jgi:hypothetical protein
MKTIVRVNKVTEEGATIKYDDRTESYMVCVGTVKKYKRLSSAVSYLKSLVGDYENASKYTKVQDDVYEMIEKVKKQEVDLNVSSELAAEINTILG